MYDFSGYATRNDIECGDGRIIRQNAFRDNDQTTVPLVWQHIHNNPDNVLGHADLENREDGVYAGESPRFLTIALASIRSVAGVSVNCCTGTKYLALRRGGLFKADVESMEGAACFAVCRRFGVPAYQFRAVSNIATDRDTSTWKIPEALMALKEQVLDSL